MTRKYTEERPTLVCDTECYRNYWSIAFLDTESERFKIFELYDGQELNRPAIAKLLRQWRIVTFNGNNYDRHMIALAMSGATNSQLKNASDDLIVGGLRSWEFSDKYGVSLPDFFDHIDLAEVSPGAAQRPSLKLYGGKMHSRRMQDLPFDPDKLVSPADRVVMREYVLNDLDITRDMYHELKPQLAIRAYVSEKHGMDLRSKSDAQMAEAIIKQEVERRLGKRIYKEDIKPGAFKFEAPEWVSFETPYLRGVFERVMRADFIVRRDGYVVLPEAMTAPITIDGATYQMGIGGLHSQESRQTFYADDKYEIQDNDVRGYYPNLMIGSGRFPKNMGYHFQEIFKGIVADREVAKARIKECEKAGDMKGAKAAKDEAETGKIMSNGTFGKAGSPYSPLYSPRMMIQTTVSGQLAILMAIERTALAGFRVISANTDGFVTVLPRAERDQFRAILWDWECDTGLFTEETNYRSIHSRDVNNYIAITTDGKVKTKGIFAASGRGLPAAAGLKKNPDVDVCSQAVVAYLTKGTPIETTINTCADVRQFIRIRREKDGANFHARDGEERFLGKAVRWYYSVDGGDIRSADSGKLVGGSTGAMPLMELPEGYDLPDALDTEWYVREAYARLHEVGVDCPDPSLFGRSGFVFATRPDQKTVHKVDMTIGVAICGATRADRRDVWREFGKRLPEGVRYCSKCRKAEEL